jgi:TrpR-related protein YerC/YecD
MEFMEGYNSKLTSESMDFLCEAILSLETKEECYRFFEDLCTINEVQSIEQRLQVAKMLKQKKTYTDIATTTGASTATISRVNRCLNYGSDGYNLVFDKIGFNNK